MAKVDITLCFIILCFIYQVSANCAYKTPITLSCRNLTSIPDYIPNTVTSLNIQSGHIVTIETSAITHLIQLQELAIEHNNINLIEILAFRNHFSLRKLSLKSNALHTLRNGIFNELQNLRELDLSENYLTSLEGGLLDGLRALEFLNMDNNQLSLISRFTFRDLVNLHKLQLLNNSIATLPDSTFQYNQQLMILDMGFNPLSEIKDVFSNSNSLHFLNLTDCQLNTFPSTLPTSLSVLNLGHNNITKNYKSDTASYTNITSLVLEKNLLSYVETGAFASMTSLANIFLFVNDLERVPGPFPVTLKVIYLDNNRITSIPPDSFAKGTAITMLSLRTNSISEIQLSSFKNVKSIHEFHLEHNPLMKLSNNGFLLASDLQYLNLNRLHLEEIQENCFLGLISLKKLELSYVKVQQENIHGNIFRQTPFLEELMLRDSPSIAEYLLSDVDTLKSVTKLKKIDLRENGLTTLNISFHHTLINLNTIKLGQNKFHCDFRLAWLQKWYKLEPGKFEDFHLVKCHTPHHYKGQRLDKVDFSKPYDDTNNVDFTTVPPDKTTFPPDYYKPYDYETYDFQFARDHYYIAEMESYTDDTFDNTNYTTLSQIIVSTPTTESQVAMTTTQSPVAMTTKQSPVAMTTKQSPVAMTTKQSPVAMTTKQSPVAMTTKQSPVAMTTKQSQVAMTTTVTREVTNINESSKTINNTTTNNGSISSSTDPLVMTNNEIKATTENPNDPDSNLSSSTSNLKSVGIAIGTAFAVIIIFLLVAGFVYMLWNHRLNVVHHNARQYQKEDYVFLVSKTDNPV